MPSAHREPGALLARHLQRVTTVAFDITDALVLILDRTGRIIRFNPTCERLSGRQEAEVQGQLLWPLVLDPVEAARAEALFRQIAPGVPPGTSETTWRTPQGDVRFIRWMASCLHDETGAIELVVCTGIDVTEERRARQALEDSETLFRTLFQHSADGVVLIDPHDLAVPWRIVRCNPAFARMNGYEPQDLIGQSIDLLHDDDLMARRGAHFLNWIRNHPDGAYGRGTHRHRGGHFLHVASSSSVVTVGGQELILGMDRDVTAAREQEAALRGANEHLAYLAQHDEWTGLLSRNAWLTRLSDMRRRPGCHVVLFLDLDGFKQVNDSYGHAVGDDLLQEVARRLRDTVRPTDAVGRLGGDEFVVAITVSGEAAVSGMTAHLDRVVSAPYRLSGLDVRVGVSIGAAVVCDEDLDVEAALERADHEMYRVKREKSD